MISESPGSIWGTLILAALLLATGHLCIDAFVSSKVVWVIGAGLVASIGLIGVLLRRNHYQFLIAMFICVHFIIGDNYGGLWSYTGSATLLLGILLAELPFKVSSVPIGINLCMLVFLVHQFLGIALNGYPAIDNVQAAVITLAQVLFFYSCTSQQFTASRLRHLVLAWFAVAGWSFVAALNQKFLLVATASPLLPQRSYISSLAAISPSGLLGASELYGEYSCMLFIFSLVMIIYFKNTSELKVSKLLQFLTMFICLAGIIIARTRSAFLLAVAATAFVFLTNALTSFSIRGIQRTAMLLAVFSLLGISIFSARQYLSVDQMVNKFGELNPAKISVTRGKGINRQEVFSPAYKKLSKGSWWLGYGYGTPESNRKSMGIENIGIKDFHSLYLALPMFYGWGGSAAFILLIFGTGLRSYLAYLTGSEKGAVFLLPIALGFALIWGIFLVDQYKITATRQPSYYLLIWMLLGWTHAAANSIRLGNLKALPINHILSR